MVWSLRDIVEYNFKGELQHFSLKQLQIPLVKKKKINEQNTVIFDHIRVSFMIQSQIVIDRKIERKLISAL